VAPELAAYLDRVAADPQVRALHDRCAELLAARPGERVLEVGCGVGTDARELAAQVLPGGEVVAVDLSEAMVAAARDRHDPALPVRYEVADVTALPYDDASFDVVRVERVLQHVGDVDRACAEMARVLRPGGRLVAIDTDWGSFALDLADRALVERVLAHVATRFVQPRAALRLRALLTGAGLADVSMEARAFTYTSFADAAVLLPMLNEAIPQEANFLPAGDRDAWFAALKAADAAGTFVAGWTAYVAVARKPAA
jgi:SAM-dependent methyltransferase